MSDHRAGEGQGTSSAWLSGSLFWRLSAGILLYPLTVVGGLHALLLVVSSLCFRVEGWTADEALHHFSLGALTLAGISALWFTTLVAPAVLARDRLRYRCLVLVLGSGLSLDLYLCWHWFQAVYSPMSRTAGIGLILLVGPLVVGSVNLVLMARARLVQLIPMSGASSLAMATEPRQSRPSPRPFEPWCGEIAPPIHGQASRSFHSSP